MFYHTLIYSFHVSRWQQRASAAVLHIMDSIPGSTPLLNMLCLAFSPHYTDPSASSVFLSAPVSCAATLWQFLVNPLARARVARVLQELAADVATDDAHAGYVERKASGYKQLLTATLSQTGVPELVLARLLRACQLVGSGIRIQGSESQLNPAFLFTADI